MVLYFAKIFYRMYEFMRNLLAGNCWPNKYLLKPLQLPFRAQHHFPTSGGKCK